MGRSAKADAKSIAPEVGSAFSVGVLLVLSAAVIQQIGAATAVTLWPVLGANTMVFIRFVVAGVILSLIARPSLKGMSIHHWVDVVLLAVALAAMSICFYNATGRIPLGIAVTVEVLGPLALSIVTAAGRIAWLWAVLAFGGVAIVGLSSADPKQVDPLGLLFAGLAAMGWAAYILMSVRAGRRYPGVQALALASLIGALGTAPLAVAAGTLHAATTWSVLGGIVLVSLMSTVIPHSLEMLSLRRISRSIFSVLTSMAPVIASLVGLVLLGQRLSWAHCVAVVLVTAASIGAVLTGRRCS